MSFIVGNRNMPSADEINNVKLNPGEYSAVIFGNNGKAQGFSGNAGFASKTSDYPTIKPENIASGTGFLGTYQKPVPARDDAGLGANLTSAERFIMSNPLSYSPAERRAVNDKIAMARSNAASEGPQPLSQKALESIAVAKAKSGFKREETSLNNLQRKEMQGIALTAMEQRQKRDLELKKNTAEQENITNNRRITESAKQSELDRLQREQQFIRSGGDVTSPEWKQKQVDITRNEINTKIMEGDINSARDIARGFVSGLVKELENASDEDRENIFNEITRVGNQLSEAVNKAGKTATNTVSEPPIVSQASKQPNTTSDKVITPEEMESDYVALSNEYERIKGSNPLKAKDILAMMQKIEERRSALGANNGK